MSGCVKFWTTRHCNQNKRHFNRVEQLQVKVLIAKTCGSCSCHELCCSSIVLMFSTQVWHTHRSRNTFLLRTFFILLLHIVRLPLLGDDGHANIRMSTHTHRVIISWNNTNRCMYCCEQTVCASAANRVGGWMLAKSPLPWASSPLLEPPFCLPSPLFSSLPLIISLHRTLNARPMSWATSSSSPCHCIKLSLDQYLLLFISLLHDTTYSFLLKLVALIPHVYTERIPNHGSQLSLK